jgi:hypothetical protein
MYTISTAMLRLHPKQPRYNPLPSNSLYRRNQLIYTHINAKLNIKSTVSSRSGLSSGVTLQSWTIEENSDKIDGI